MGTKKILLIENDIKHTEKTIEIINELNDMYTVKGKSFLYSPQNGDNVNMLHDRIKEYIISEFEKDSFDIIMIDMLLGGDSTENPIGLKLIQELYEFLKAKKIIVYTEMSSEDLDRIKEYNKEKGYALKIVNKPNGFSTNRVCCSGVENKKALESKGAACNLDLCNQISKLKCDMKCIYYEMEEKV